MAAGTEGLVENGNIVFTVTGLRQEMEHGPVVPKSKRLARFIRRNVALNPLHPFRVIAQSSF
jgi:hypothetical protein